MIPTYHEIAPERSRYVYSSTTAQLKEHLGLLKRFEEEFGAPQVTFDDGHASHYRHALPILEEAGIKGTFFVTAGWTETKPGYMSWRELRELAALGHQVQSHGWSHALLTHCKPKELANELHRSRRSLEDRLGMPVDAISTPGGRWDWRVLKACACEGYRRVFVSDPYLIARGHGGLILAGRLMVRREHGASELIALLRSERKPWSAARLAFQMKQAGRTILGDRIYHRLWSWMGASGARETINQQYYGNSQ
jgi:peptidoglycan/xylan/chitin deacetylase (PgdA/CDA1 family)